MIVTMLTSSIMYKSSAAIMTKNILELLTQRLSEKMYLFKIHNML